jgi:myo-inositol-1-phosphate synthase
LHKSTNSISTTPDNEIKKWAGKVQNESLYFGCASALFGLTKMIHDADSRKFDYEHSKRISTLKQKCTEAINNSNFEQLNKYNDELKKLLYEDDAPELKFFYINFFDIPSKLKEHAKNLGARLDHPDVFQADNNSSDLLKNIYFISLSVDVMKDILESEEIPKERKKEAKHKQRTKIAHEMAHEIFRKFAPELNTEENARIFAVELLKLREYYINGTPA